MRVDSPCQACKAWTWQAFGIRRVGAHCCWKFFLFWSFWWIGFLAMAQGAYVFVTCLFVPWHCVKLSYHVISCHVTFWWCWPQKSCSRWIQSLELSCAAMCCQLWPCGANSAVEAMGPEVLYTSSAPQWLGSVGKLASRPQKLDISQDSQDPVENEFDRIW